MQEPTKNVSYAIRLGRQKKCLGFLTDSQFGNSEMADILTDYRKWRDAQPVRVSTHSDRCHMYHDRCMIHRLADALERARLTDEEREAVQAAMNAYGENNADPECAAIEATLWGLLERTK